MAARLLGLWVRIRPGTWMSVCCECCVLSGRGLCDGFITCPGQCYRLWCVVVCDLETSWMGGPWPTGGGGAVAPKPNKQTNCCENVISCTWFKLFTAEEDLVKFTYISKPSSFTAYCSGNLNCLRVSDMLSGYLPSVRKAAILTVSTCIHCVYQWEQRNEHIWRHKQTVS